MRSSSPWVFFFLSFYMAYPCPGTLDRTATIVCCLLKGTTLLYSSLHMWNETHGGTPARVRTRPPKQAAAAAAADKTEKLSTAPFFFPFFPFIPILSLSLTSIFGYSSLPTPFSLSGRGIFIGRPRESFPSSSHSVAMIWRKIRSTNNIDG